MGWFFRLEKYIQWTLIALLVFMGASYFWSFHLSEQLKEAEAQTQSAIDELQRVKGLSAYQKAELERITAQADEDIARADKRIAELTDIASVRKSLIDRLMADNAEISQQLMDIINQPVLPEPLPASELIEQAVQLYYPREFESIELTGNREGLQLFTLMISEIEQRRELDFTNSKIITEQSKQITNLDTVISEQESKFSGLQSKFDAQSGLVTSFENEIAGYDKVITAKDNEIKLLNKANFWGSWQGKTVTVFIGGGCLYLGSKL